MAAGQHSVGDTVFFRHPQHSWILGKVAGSSAKGYACQAEDTLRGLHGDAADNLPATHVEAVMGSVVDEDVEDLLQLTVLHDATLLRCLCLRYLRDHIYTNIGAIVVALNPFTFSIPWYLDSEMSKYLTEGERIERNLPHSWAQAHNTYFELVRDAAPQFILVSGESGSGKTEASKMVVKYFAALSKKRGDAAAAEKSAVCGVRLQQCSPILECFGNAKTVRNDNSSRFGKFMKIQFEPATFMLVGSHTTRYLLEKSRIVTAAAGERVYHSFYLLHKASAPISTALGLRPQGDYKTINAGGVIDNGDFSSTEDFVEVSAAMTTVGVTDDCIRTVWGCTSSVMSLLNVAFTKNGGGDSVNVAAASMGDVALAAKLWGISAEDLRRELVSTEFVVRGEASTKQHTEIQANDVRDALGKATYNGLFGWLVDQCNRMCDFGDTGGNWIGLLDIFGFEDFKVNSFEQLCINLTNETLQNHYNTFIFAKDMEECKAEGIDTAAIVCPDNSPCVALMCDPAGGILALLDDECALGKGSDQGFIDNVINAHNAHADFIVNKTSRIHFSVRHYAGDVRYDVTNWLEKNRDNLKDSLKLLLRASSDALVAGLLPEPVERRGGRAVTVGGFFRSQLASLMTVINSSNPHWIRCIKPHPAKKPRMFDGITAMQQLESSGVLGTVKIRKAGYPVRMAFDMFTKRFALLLPTSKEAWAAVKLTGVKAKEIALQLLKNSKLSNPAQWQCGKTKLFLKPDALAAMEKMRNERRAACVVRMQSAGRGALSRRATGRLIVVRAITTIVLEYRDYAERTAASREAQRAFREAQRAESLALTSQLLAEHMAALSASWHSCCDTMVRAIVEFEGPLRAILVSDGLTTTMALGSSFVLFFVIDDEERVRERLERRLLRTQLIEFLDALEELMAQTVYLERWKRLDIVEEEERAFRAVSSGDSRRFMLEVEEAARRGDIVTRVRVAYADLLADHFGHLRLWLEKGPHAVYSKCEPQARRVIFEQEADERRLRKVFEQKMIWRALLASIEGDEGDERQYLISEYEPHFRGDVQRQHLLARSMIALRESSWTLFTLEQNIRRQLWVIQCEARATVEAAAAMERHLYALARVELEEEGFRDRVQVTEMCYRQLLADAVMPRGVIEAVSDVQQDESYWRGQVHLLERRARVLLNNAQARLRVITGEHGYRRLLFLFSCANRYETAERGRLERAEATAFMRFVSQEASALSASGAFARKRNVAATIALEEAMWQQVEQQERERLRASADRLAAAFPQFEAMVHRLVDDEASAGFVDRAAELTYRHRRDAELGSPLSVQRPGARQSRDPVADTLLRTVRDST
jgi:hypothetical protein